MESTCTDANSVESLENPYRMLTEEEVDEMKTLLFGSEGASFPDSWTVHGFKFKVFPPYGLIQTSPGPCGVISSVQAMIIYELLFGKSRIVMRNGFLRPDFAERRRALARAITTILWAARSEESVTVAKKNPKATSQSTAEGERIVEKISVVNFDSKEDLFDHICCYIKMFMTAGGICNFMYSLLLTRGIDKIKEDMDFSDNCLIGSDSYCSQEVINLILVGMAVTNVFDGQTELQYEEETIIFKGIPRESKIGFLSLNDDNSPVGDFYKNPEYPIWVLNGNSHYFVLFGTSKDILKTRENFKMYYVDSLSEAGEIRLTIEQNIISEEEDSDTNVCSNSVPRNLPATIRCIYTRWPRSNVEIQVVDKE